jgi:hypothetical protein
MSVFFDFFGFFDFVGFFGLFALFKKLLTTILLKGEANQMLYFCSLLLWKSFVACYVL